MLVPDYDWDMTLRLHTFLAGLLALLMALLLALALVAAKPLSGEYQLFESAESGDQHAISLAALENFDYHAKIAPECCNATKGTGRNGSAVGSFGDANFAQTSIRSDRAFSPDGQQIYSDIAGYQIRTVDDLSRAPKRGDISPADVPVDFVDMNGSRIILNTRTSTALQDAGIPQNQWYGTQRTGQAAYTDAADNPVTYNDLAVNQLNNNNLPPTDSPTLLTGQ